MVNRLLVTTPLEETWPENLDSPVLFLGEWCRRYNRIDVWKDLNAEVVAYHWDDRHKLQQDYLAIQILYEELLHELSEQLNLLHGVKHSVRYWRILVGPWLGYFVQILFDRWAMIERVVNKHPNVRVRALDTRAEKFVPNDMNHFTQLFTGDSWNEAIYVQLLQGWTEIPIEQVPSVVDCGIKLTDSRRAIIPHRFKRKFSRLLSSISQKFSSDNEGFLIADYLPIKQSFCLQWRMGQFPKFWRPFPTPKVEVAWATRQWRMRGAQVEGFPAIVREMIPRHIPTLYLEGYSALESFCRDLPWPKEPRLIFTSNSYSSDDVFKAWAAKKAEVGVPLVIGQHGGSYGMALWGFTEDHQIAISDCWLSWGWEDQKRPQIQPVGNLKMIGRDIGWDNNGGALMVEVVHPRYSYHIYSAPVASQWLDYFEDQFRFIAALPESLRGQLVVRLYKQDYGWDQKLRWQDRWPGVRLDEGTASIIPLIKKSRLYISTYNATTFLESLALNIPTIIFWNPKHWELNESATTYIDRLSTVGIFHATPESAANHMTKVWDDVVGWWGSESVQTVRKAFCHRYSRTPEHPLDEIELLLKRIARSAHAE